MQNIEHLKIYQYFVEQVNDFGFFHNLGSQDNEERLTSYLLMPVIHHSSTIPKDTNV